MIINLILGILHHLFLINFKIIYYFSSLFNDQITIKKINQQTFFLIKIYFYLNYYKIIVKFNLYFTFLYSEYIYIKNWHETSCKIGFHSPIRYNPIHNQLSEGFAYNSKGLSNS